MAAGAPPRVAEEYPPWVVDQLVNPHTLGRSFYMRPGRRPQLSDKVYTDNDAFWTDVLDERIGAERNVTLKGFNVFEWVPRNPGLFHTPDARWARTEAQNHVRSIEAYKFTEYIIADGAPPDGAMTFRTATASDGSARALIYTPQGKISMLNGGVGCVRFKPLQLKSGGTAWLMSATSSDAPDEGIPLLIGDDDYQYVSDELQESGAVRCDLRGRTRFVADEFKDLFSIQRGIPRLYVEVSELTLEGRINVPGQVSVAASFLSTFEGAAKIYASYVTFDPGRRGARVGAAQWLKEEYVQRLYQGTLLTDFDQRAPLFADALFTLDQVLTSPRLTEKIAKLTQLYGSFDWAQLDRFSYVEHQGDLIVTNNTITVSDSTNVLIQNDIKHANVTAGSFQAGDESQKNQLKVLLQQLQDALAKAPFDKEAPAKAVAQQAKDLVDAASGPKPNQFHLDGIAHGLKRTADFLKDAVPSVAAISAQIVSVIGKIHGLSL